MADINFEDIQPFVEGQGDSGLTARQKIKRNFERVKEVLLSMAQLSTIAKFDFAILDERGNAIVSFIQGHIVTRNFDSRNSATKSELQNAVSLLRNTLPNIDNGTFDFGIKDENGKYIVIFKNGHIKTKYFDSENLNIEHPVSVEICDNDFEIKDSQGNTLAIFANGHFRTKYFDSSNIKIKDIEYSKEECISAFVDVMNKYASDFGMSHTHFLNASGQHMNGHYSCAKDIMKMCACCTAYEKLMRIWGQEAYSINVTNKGVSRTVSGTSTYKGAAMESVGNYYHIYGGKSGTWNFGGSIGTVRNLTLAVKSKVDDEWLIGCIIQSSNTDRGIPFKQLLDWLEDYRVDNTVSIPTIAASYAAAGVLQKGNPMAYADVDWMMVGKDAETQYYPASMTKLMTAMVVLDYCNLDEKMTIISSDIQSGNPVYADGDTMTIYDAVLAMLLPSSNTLAVALSRFVGNKILNIKNK